MLRLFVFAIFALPLFSFAGDKLPEITFKDLPGKSINPVSYTHLTLPTKA